MAYINGKEVLFSAKVVETPLSTLYPPNITISGTTFQLDNSTNGKHGSHFTWKARRKGTAAWSNNKYPAQTMKLSLASAISAYGGYYMKSISVEGENFNAGVLDEELYFDGSGTEIAENQYKRSALESIDIASNIATIGARAFQQCQSLENVIIRYGCRILGDYAFDNSRLIKKIRLPSTVVSIGIAAFQYTNITEIIIPSSVVSIGWAAFKFCANLKTAKIESNAQINQQMFKDCISLETVTFTATSSKIDASTFEGCTSLKDIFVPWSEGAVANAPWGAPNATIHYNSEV